MDRLLNRSSGLFFVAFGIVLYFVVIPYDTEPVDYGWVRPQSVPNAMAWIIAIAGLVQLIRPRGGISADIARMSRAALHLLIVACGVLAISQFGFRLVSPLLALTIMLTVGERRPVWLVLGVIGIPVLIWFVVAVLLGRPLP